MATGATQKLGQKWAESDAKKAIAKGLAPSKFDKYLGMASAGAGLGSMAFGGALSGLGKAGTVGAGVGKGASLSSIASQAGTGASKLGNLGKIASAAVGKGNVGGWQGAVGKLAGDTVGNKVLGQTLDESVADSGWQGQLKGILSSAANTRGADTPSSSQNSVPVGSNLAQPRASGGLAGAVAVGRNTALMNQPWRQGYEIKTIGPDDAEGNPTVITNQTPPIYPNRPPSVMSPPISESTPIANRFNDELTSRRVARKRNPEPVEEY